LHIAATTSLRPHPVQSCPMLILKRASKSRPSGEWSDDDYDVFNGE
jgi:hypothetical protein